MAVTGIICCRYTMRSVPERETIVGDAMLLIIWHSRTGATEAMARAAHDAALAEGPCRLIAAGEATAGDMLAATAYLFCCPENLAAISGAMKEFFDRTYYALLGQIEGRAYATIIAAGTDGSAAQRQIDRVATGWRLRRVAKSLILRNGAQTPEAILAHKSVPADALQMCRDMGQAFSGGISLGVF